MNKSIIALLFVILTPCASASNRSVKKLQCAGTFSKYVQPAANNVPVSGIYVEITKDNVLVSGSIGFDGNYRITQRPKSGLNFVMDSDETRSGYINRYNGEIDLAQHLPDNPDRIILIINAKCRPAKAMF